MFKVLVFITICFISLSVKAQSSKLNFERLFIEKGQSQVHILSIFKDSKGFLWFGTYSGVYRYDGTKFIHFTHNFEDSTSISNSSVNCIFEDNENHLWFGTENGLNMFDRETEKFVHFQSNTSNSNSLSCNNVKAIIQDKQNLLWIATYGGGLNCLNIKTKKIVSFIKNTNDKTRYAKLNCLYIDSSNKLWIGGEQCGLAYFNNNSQQFSPIQLIPNKSNQQLTVNSIFEDKQGIIWLGTWGDGLLKIEPSKPIVQYLHKEGENNSLVVNVVRSVSQDRQGQIWIGTFSGSIDILNKESNTFQHVKYQYNNDKSISSDIIWQLFTDPSGIVWVGTFGAGISKFDPYASKFPLFQANPFVTNSLSNNPVSCIRQISNGLVWIGTVGGGINIFDPKTQQFTKAKLPNFNLQGNIRSIFEDSRHMVWIGTDNGFIRTDINCQKYEFLASAESQAESLQNKTIHCILEDKDANLWMGTWGNGLYFISKAEAEKSNLSSIKPLSFLYPQIGAPNLPISIIPSLLEDSKGRIWIGTLAGIYLYKPENRQFIFYSNNVNNQKPENNFSVSAIFEDKDHVIWIGSFGQGIARFDPLQKNTRYYSESDGFVSGTVSGIVQDTKGYLWVSTMKGLCRVNIANMSVKNYDKSDGLQDNTFSYNAFCTLNDGQLVFGGVKGFNIFKPNTLIDNPFAPAMAFTDFKLFNQSVKLGDESGILNKVINEVNQIKLNYTQYSFSIFFTNLSFSLIEKCQFAYKLVGWDKDWIYTNSDNPIATYSNLSGGKYTFLVKACNSDGVWNNNPKSLEIVIIPPFWKTWWFNLFCFAILIYAVYYLLKYNVKRANLKKDLQIKLNEILFEEERTKKQAEIVELQKEKLDQELLLKNKELAVYVMNVIQKNEKIGFIRDNINELIPIANSETQKKIHSIVKNIEEELETDSNWEKFAISFNTIHDNFLKRLAEQFETMTTNDLRICAYIRMNLSNKEIANLLNISVRTIESTRYRVRKKLDLEIETNLNEYLMRF